MEELEKITIAFLWNNDPDQVNQSFRKMVTMIEKQGEDLYPLEWSKQHHHLAEIDFLLTALATTRKEVINAFKTTLEDKSPEDQQKQISELNHALYYPDDDLS